MATNYCNCDGLISVCKVADNPIKQQICEFSVPASHLNKTSGKYCMYRGKAVEDQCDCYKAQWYAKHGKSEEAVPLSEEEVFDVRNQATHPIYGITY